MNDVLLFTFEQWPPDICDILIQNLSFKYRKELWKFIHDYLPFTLSNWVALTFSFCLVDEDLSLVEANIESSDDSSSTHSHFKPFLFVDFISNIIFSLLDKQYFIYFIQLNINHFLLLKDPWFQTFQNFNHKVLIHNVVPLVISMFNFSFTLFPIFILNIHWKIKELPKAYEENTEKKITVNFSLNMAWKLFD